MCNEKIRMHGMHNMHLMHYNCGRNFFTKEEKIELLEKYKKWLENEQKGVDEAIDEFKKAS
jgi:hypothetical protein